MIRNIWTVTRRDLRAYFTSPIAYIVIAGFTLIMGWMFVNTVNYFVTQSQAYQQFNPGKGISVTDGIIRPLYGNMNVIFLFLTPFITMRLFAEERKNNTIELLMTSPLTLWEIILGKFLSAFLLVAVMISVTLTYPAMLSTLTTPDFGPIFSSILGTLLLTSCYLSVGILFSAMTENQIVAGALTFSACLFFWLVNWAAQSAGPVFGEVLTYLSLIAHFNNLSQGLISSSDIVFYLSFVFLGLFLTNRVLDSFRWR
jgi:ABC-2 type transport system permease protein